MWSWFPNPRAWEVVRSGVNWLDWTERSEDIFLNIIEDINCGKGKPKSHTGWISHLRGQTVSRALIKQNNICSQQFMDSTVPTGQRI